LSIDDVDWAFRLFGYGLMRESRRCPLSQIGNGVIDNRNLVNPSAARH
jgi:hypothetical protein